MLWGLAGVLKSWERHLAGSRRVLCGNLEKKKLTVVLGNKNSPGQSLWEKSRRNHLASIANDDNTPFQTLTSCFWVKPGFKPENPGRCLFQLTITLP